MRLEQSTHCVFAYTGHRIDGLTGHPMSAPVPKKTRKEDYQVRLLRELCSRIFLDPCEKKLPQMGRLPLLKKNGQHLTLPTAKAGGVSSANNVLPYGTYVIFETKAPAGYHKNEAFEEGVVFKIREKGGMVLMQGNTGWIV